MPEAVSLQLLEHDGEVFVFRGSRLFSRYDKDDLGMRNVVVVALSDAGISVNEVATCFSLSRQYVSMLRGRAKDAGSAGLVRPRGRKKSLTPSKWHKALCLSEQGVSDREIARRFGVHHGTVARHLALVRSQRGMASELALQDVDAEAEVSERASDNVTPEQNAPTPATDAVAPDTDTEAPDEGGGCSEPATVLDPDGGRLLPEPLVRSASAEVPSRYAGAMLLHPFLSRLGVDDVLRGIGDATARRYDAASLVLSSAFGFALGISSLEGAKHLRTKDAGALVGLSSFPHLRTLRPRLKDLAEESDPLEIQRAFSKAMLAADDHPPEVFYVDDHFVTYWGGRPVAKGYNIRRHLAEPGRDDTFVTDEHWRAICFSSGEPRGLSVSMHEVIGQLKEIADGRAVMVGFDRGGSYPKVFSELAEAGVDWVTWRRAPLVAPTVAPRRSWVTVDGKRRTLLLADELVALKDYEEGPVRQLSAYEDAKVCFQVLTSNTTFRPAPVVHKLKGRWSIENFNKYIEDHHGAHWLATYAMDLEEDTAPVPNPERKVRRQAKSAAESAVAEAERSLGQAMEQHYPSTDKRIAAINARRDELTMAKDALEEASAALKGVPAKLPRNELDPNAKRAKPRLAARALQMVCRLLAYNAELDLARRLNTYLTDPDEYRSITRNLLHLGGTIAFGTRSIAVTLDRPDSPRASHGHSASSSASSTPVRRPMSPATVGRSPTGSPGDHVNGSRRPTTGDLSPGRRRRRGTSEAGRHTSPGSPCWPPALSAAPRHTTALR